jgi:hypothetical protein
VQRALHSQITTNVLTDPVIHQDFCMAEFGLRQHANLGKKLGRDDQNLFVCRLDHKVLVLMLSLRISGTVS